MPTPKTANGAALYEGWSDRHHAGEGQIRSIFVAGGYDRGELTLEPGRVRFRGMRSVEECNGVVSIDLARQAFPWPIVLGVAVLFLGIAWMKSPGHVSLRSPFSYVVLGILGVASILQIRERWVEVTWNDGGPFLRRPMRSRAEISDMGVRW
ncbi:MAG: hypothetical protein ACKV19_17825 [Verrucomicrobiales bacterium]